MYNLDRSHSLVLKTYQVQKVKHYNPSCKNSFKNVNFDERIGQETSSKGIFH